MTKQTLLFQDREPLSPQPKAPARAESEGERLKRIGMARAAKSGADLLAVAREFAFDIQRENGGECDADKVAAAMQAEGYPSLGNAAGSIFVCANWTWTGRFVKSTRSQAHQNLLRVWRWKHA